MDDMEQSLNFFLVTLIVTRYILVKILIIIIMISGLWQLEHKSILRMTSLAKGHSLFAGLHDVRRELVNTRSSYKRSIGNVELLEHFIYVLALLVHTFQHCISRVGPYI